MIQINHIYPGDCIEVMRTWPANFVDTIITDPPYGIRFMGKAWDGEDIEKMVHTKLRKTTTRTDGGLHDGRAFAAGTYDQSLSANQSFQAWCCAWATEALRIAKPGAMMLVSGGTRTFHRMTAGLEDAGWEIRDCMMWLYGSGFPKSHNLHGNFEGWGTALKPAWEPIIVAMKPLDGTFAENAETWGVAGINVDGGRVKGGGKKGEGGRTSDVALGTAIFGNAKRFPEDDTIGRWPANLILDEDAAAMLDGQSGHSVSRPHMNKAARASGSFNASQGEAFSPHSDTGGASRFFYCAKASKSERNKGCEDIPQQVAGMKNESGRNLDGTYEQRVASNHHPTVKPLSLMEYLCTLTKTPTGGIVLDPFAGSGSTLIAAERTGRPWIGIEMNAEYIAIATARIADEGTQLKMAV